MRRAEMECFVRAYNHSILYSYNHHTKIFARLKLFSICVIETAFIFEPCITCNESRSAWSGRIYGADPRPKLKNKACGPTESDILIFLVWKYSKLQDLSNIVGSERTFGNMPWYDMNHTHTKWHGNTATTILRKYLTIMTLSSRVEVKYSNWVGLMRIPISVNFYNCYCVGWHRQHK